MTVLRRALTCTGWRGRGLDFLIGALSVLGHAPFHIWPLTIIGFAYLMLRLDAARGVGKGGFSRGIWFGIGYFLLGTFWIGSAFIVRGPEFIPAMPPMILGLAVLLALFGGLAGWAYVRFSGAGVLRWAALAGLLMLAEFTRGYLFGGFPWNLPGYIFKAGGAMSQSAAFIGIYGLSFLVFLFSAVLAYLVDSRRYIVVGASVGVVLAGLFILGQVRLSNATITYVDTANIRVVQVPFSQKDKFERGSAVAIVNEFIRQSLSPGIEDVTHLVWPEGAVIGDALENRPLIDAVGTALTRNDDTPPYWLLNSLRSELHPVEGQAPRWDYYNTSAVIEYDAQGYAAVQGFNDKHRLVPFGEFIPGGQWMEKLGSKTLSTSLASIVPAPTKELSNFPGLPTVSPQICYEIIFSRLTPRPKTGERAQWILNQSNDAWYGRSVGPAQHANIAAYRAIEEGLPVLRSASNGVSGMIDPYGRYTHSLGPQETGVLDLALPVALPKSYLSRKHNFSLFLIILSITVMTILVSGFRGGNRETLNRKV